MENADLAEASRVTGESRRVRAARRHATPNSAERPRRHAYGPLEDRCWPWSRRWAVLAAHATDEVFEFTSW